LNAIHPVRRFVIPLESTAENVHETELSDLDIFVREDEGAPRGVEGLLFVDGVGLIRAGVPLSFTRT
jgi:hypothetical protein